MHVLPRSLSPLRAIPQRIGLLICVATGCLVGAAQAANLPQQRQAFLQAEQALRGGQNGDYQRLKHSLQDYPLLPYIEYAELPGNLSGSNGDLVRRFLNRYPDGPLTDRLRSAWLLQLASQQRWREFLDFYQPSKSTELRCHHLAALIATGQREQAFSQVEPLWRVGRSQPDACDPVFDAWIGAGRVTARLAWARIALAIDAGESGLARYLKRFLNTGDQAWVERWLQVRANPGLILGAGEFSSPHPWREAILVSGLERLAHQQPQRTPDAWEILKRRYRFDAEQQTAARHAVALAYLRFLQPEALERLAGVDGADDPDIQRKRILLALEKNDWVHVLSWIDALRPADRASAQWRYWKGRALQQLGRRGEAQTLLAQVAQDRTYYAFLAADRSGQDYYLVDKPLQVDPALLRRMANQGSALRAQELLALGRTTDARREWRSLTRDLDAGSLKVAARLAADWGWRDQAIFTLARSDSWDDLALRFPLEHLDLVNRQASENGIQTPWVLAVMRQESAFAEDAQSPVGARGLMQLMPATARQVAQRLGQSRPDGMDLFRPETNIPLGAAYLSQIYQRLDRHPVLATAAYNAGPGRVAQWLPDRTLDADIWVETIPFRETRTYVQRVMAYAVIYEKRLGRKPGSIVQRMRPIAGAQDHGGNA